MSISATMFRAAAERLTLPVAHIRDVFDFCPADSAIACDRLRVSAWNLATDDVALVDWRPGGPPPPGTRGWPLRADVIRASGPTCAPPLGLRGVVCGPRRRLRPTSQKLLLGGGTLSAHAKAEECRLARRLVADVAVMTVAAAARRHGLSWNVVMALVRCWSDRLAEHRRSRRCRVLLVDETSMRRRHRCVTVIVNADTGKTLAMVPHRSAAALSGFFIAQGRRWFGRFCDLYETGELPEFHDIVDTIISWSDEILAWHHTNRASNGRIEGTNNLLQVLRHTAHGFTNFANYRIRALLYAGRPNWALLDTLTPT